ncbi:protein GRIM REAPER-like [Neltuma alba]|uniref:protein GRIM REAPER-like n=1 Tax=Neltuma alba TaxID=207710 RepID=UPI0010A4DED2|nr:protein GRIM REAPER-like [Prosopis alba]
MAKTLMKLTTIILTTLIVLLSLHPQMALSTGTEDTDEEEEEYVVDPPLFSHLRTRSRFLASKIIIKKGRRCDNSSVAHNICNGIPSSKGTGLLFCCKKHCRNVLSDKNNCGQCGHKCKQGERCCNGICTNVLFNGGSHCGKCNKKCSAGVSCDNGFCGYA